MGLGGRAAGMPARYRVQVWSTMVRDRRTSYWLLFRKGCRGLQEPARGPSAAGGHSYDCAKLIALRQELSHHNGGRYGSGPVQSNGMCLAEFAVYSNLKPNASTERIVDFPQVMSCEPGPVSLPWRAHQPRVLARCAGRPNDALAKASTLPAISTPQWA